MKSKTFLILQLIVLTMLTSCDKNEPIEPIEPIEFVNLTLKKTELTSVIIEAIVKNSQEYEYGFVINKSDFNTITDPDNLLYFKVENNFLDTVTFEITGLNASTLYYCTFYYVNSGEYNYDGPVISFRTKELVNIEYDSVNDIEGRMYKTIKIGEQTWMAENLRTITYNDGTPIENLISNEQWYNDRTGGYCWYDNDTNYKNTKGALYNGYTIESNKLCPDGWHIPKSKEWRQLIDYLNNNGFLNYQAEALKSESGWFDDSNGENHYGFDAIPSGYRNEIGGNYAISSFVAYWSSDKNFQNQFYSWKLNLSNELQPWIGNRNVGKSVRCIKD
jgi:uncharacterized protein (TIGR02145 family)